MPALSANVQQLGVPVGALTLSGTMQEIALTMVNRINGVVQALAIDVSGNPVAFIYSETSGGTLITVPAGSGIRLPVFKTQSWWFKQGSSAAPSLQLTCVG